MGKYVGKEGNSVHCLWVNSKIFFKERSRKCQVASCVYSALEVSRK